MDTRALSDTKKSGGIWNKGFVLLFILTIFDHNAFIGIRTIFTAYVQNDLSFTYAMAGMLTGIISVASLFSRPVAGKLLGGKISHKRILIIAELCSAITTPFYLIFTSYPLMILIRTIHGFFYGIASTCTVTMAGNTLSKERMGTGMGTFGIGMMITLGVSPTIATEIYSRIGAVEVFLFCCATSVLAVVLSFIVPPIMPKALPEESGSEAPRGIKSLILKRSLPSSLLNCAAQFAYASISTFIVVYGGSRGWGQIGLFYLVYSFGSFIARPITGRIYDKHGMVPVVFLCTASFIVGIFMLALTTNFYLCLLSALFCCLGFGGGWSVYQADAINCDNPADRGRASSTYFMFSDTGAFLGALVAGYLVSYTGYSATFMLYTIPLFLSAVIYSVTLFRKKKH